MKNNVKNQRDRQRVPPIGHCGHCGEEFYPGMLCWCINSVTLCEACFSRWIREEMAAYFVPVEEVTL